MRLFRTVASQKKFAVREPRADLRVNEGRDMINTRPPNSDPKGAL